MPKHSFSISQAFTIKDSVFISALNPAYSENSDTNKKKLGEITIADSKKLCLNIVSAFHKHLPSKILFSYLP